MRARKEVSHVFCKNALYRHFFCKNAKFHWLFISELYIFALNYKSLVYEATQQDKDSIGRTK